MNPVTRADLSEITKKVEENMDEVVTKVVQIKDEFKTNIAAMKRSCIDEIVNTSVDPLHRTSITLNHTKSTMDEMNMKLNKIEDKLGNFSNQHTADADVSLMERGLLEEQNDVHISGYFDGANDDWLHNKEELCVPCKRCGNMTRNGDLCPHCNFEACGTCGGYKQIGTRCGFCQRTESWMQTRPHCEKCSTAHGPDLPCLMNQWGPRVDELVEELNNLPVPPSTLPPRENETTTMKTIVEEPHEVENHDKKKNDWEKQLLLIAKKSNIEIPDDADSSDENLQKEILKYAAESFGESLTLKRMMKKNKWPTVLQNFLFLLRNASHVKMSVADLNNFQERTPLILTKAIKSARKNFEMEKKRAPVDSHDGNQSKNFRNNKKSDDDFAPVDNHDGYQSKKFRNNKKNEYGRMQNDTMNGQGERGFYGHRSYGQKKGYGKPTTIASPRIWSQNGPWREASHSCWTCDERFFTRQELMDHLNWNPSHLQAGNFRPPIPAYSPVPHGYVPRINQPRGRLFR